MGLVFGFSKHVVIPHITALAEIVSKKKMATSWLYYVHYVDCKFTSAH